MMGVIEKVLMITGLCLAMVALNRALLRDWH